MSDVNPNLLSAKAVIAEQIDGNVAALPDSLPLHLGVSSSYKRRGKVIESGDTNPCSETGGDHNPSIL